MFILDPNRFQMHAYNSNLYFWALFTLKLFAFDALQQASCLQQSNLVENEIKKIEEFILKTNRQNNDFFNFYFLFFCK